MLTVNKWFVASLVIFAGEIITIDPSNAQAAFDHDTTSVPTNQSLVDTSVPTNSINGTVDPDTGVFTVEGLGNAGNEIVIPPDIVQSLNDISGAAGNSTITGDGNTFGAAGNGTTTGDGNTLGSTDNSNSTITGDTNTLGSDSANAITICFSDPCIPSGESTQAITLNKLAELIEDDLQQSLNELAAAEKISDNQPRRFVRRRSTDCINPAIQAREVVQTKLEESRQFIEQIEQLNPENNIW